MDQEIHDHPFLIMLIKGIMILREEMILTQATVMRVEEYWLIRLMADISQLLLPKSRLM